MLVTGPFPRVRSLVQIHGDVGRYHNDIKQLKPRYSARQVHENGSLAMQYVFALPESLDIELDRDFVDV